MQWKELEGEIDNLASLITEPIEIIAPIARGGLIPGRLLASKLHVKTMYSLSVAKSQKQRKVVTEIKTDLVNKHVLLVEDMLETGTSMIAAKKYLEKRGAIVRTACLYTMPKTQMTPNYSLRIVTAIVSFPWE